MQLRLVGQLLRLRAGLRLGLGMQAGLRRQLCRLLAQRMGRLVSQACLGGHARLARQRGRHASTH